MKNTIKNLIIALMLTFQIQFVFAQHPTHGVHVATPLIPRKEVGIYLPELERVHRLFVEKRLFEFYEKSSELIKKLHEERMDANGMKK
jgi:hypothetical protein